VRPARRRAWTHEQSHRPTAKGRCGGSLEGQDCDLVFIELARTVKPESSFGESLNRVSIHPSRERKLTSGCRCERFSMHQSRRTAPAQSRADSSLPPVSTLGTFGWSLYRVKSLSRRNGVKKVDADTPEAIPEPN
jgi:hypothetical protein